MIKVHIERLVLEGLPVMRSEGPLVQAAVQAELSRLLAEGGLGPGLASGWGGAVGAGGGLPARWTQPGPDGQADSQIGLWWDEQRVK